MVKSKFTGWAYGMVICMFFLCYLTMMLVLQWNDGDTGKPIPLVAKISLFFIVVCAVFYLIIVELYRKMARFYVDGNLIKQKRLLGLAKEESFDLAQFDGFSICIIPTTGRVWEEFYLVRDSKKVVVIPQIYQKNYTELKEEILKQELKFLGYEKYSLLRDIRESF